MFLIRGCILQVNGICHFKVLYVHTFISRVLQLTAKTQLMGQPQYPAFAPNFIIIYFSPNLIIVWFLFLAREVCHVTHTRPRARNENKWLKIRDCHSRPFIDLGPTSLFTIGNRNNMGTAAAADAVSHWFRSPAKNIPRDTWLINCFQCYSHQKGFLFLGSDNKCRCKLCNANKNDVE